MAGMIPVLFLVGLLLFLTFDNLLSSTAVYGDKFGNAYEVEGLAAILVNLGIFGLIAWLGYYLAFLVKRSPKLVQVHIAVGVVSVVFIAVGLVYGLS